MGSKEDRGKALDIFSKLKESVLEINSRWIVSKQLFATEEAVRILLETSESVFDIIFWSLYDSIVLSVSRLTDEPPKKGKQSYYTFLKLSSFIERPAQNRIRDNIHIHNDDFKHIRTLRDKVIAHSDRNAKDVDGLSRNQIDVAVSALNRLMYIVELELAESHLSYSEVDLGSDGNNVVKVLKRESERIKRNRDGRKYVFFPGIYNIDKDVYDLTGLSIDRNVNIASDMFDAVFELFGAVEESKQIIEQD